MFSKFDGFKWKILEFVVWLYILFNCSVSNLLWGWALLFLGLSLLAGCWHDLWTAAWSCCPQFILQFNVRWYCWVAAIEKHPYFSIKQCWNKLDTGAHFSLLLYYFSIFCLLYFFTVYSLLFLYPIANYCQFDVAGRSTQTFIASNWGTTSYGESY